MFKDLQRGYQVHLLDKTQRVPKYYVGTIVGVSDPRVENPMPQMGQIQPNFNAFGGDRVRDLTIEFGGTTKTIVVSEMASVTSNSALTLSCALEPIANEVRAIQKQNEDEIASLPLRKEIVAECEDILSKVIPAYGDAKAQNERFDRLERSMTLMVETMQQMALAVAGTGKSSKSKKEEKDVE